MAAEAVFKINEAEEKGSERIKIATEKAKGIIQQAEADGKQKQKAIISEANAMKAAMIEKARNKAVEDSAGLVKRGVEEKNKILKPEKSKFDSAVDLVIERIVNFSGYR